MGYRSIFAGLVAMCAVAVCAVSCNKLEETVTANQERIRAELKGQSIWERNNLPDDPPPTRIAGYFDIVKGAYRYITNEYLNDVPRPDRELLPAVNAGDSISFYFDARIYKGRWDSSTTFYTNIESQRSFIKGGNDQYSTDFWPIVPLRIKLGSDPQILKSLQTALISCRTSGSKTVVNEGNEVVEKVEGDIVRVFLTPDIAYGDKWVYGIPAGSTLVFEVTDIQIIE